MFIQIKNLSFAYKVPGYPAKQVLKNINLEIDRGESVGIIGLSGSGKSTLMHHFTGLLKPDKGKVFVDGQNLWQKKIDQTPIRQKIGLVFQFPEKQLFKETVFEDIAVAPTNMGLDKAGIAERVQTAMISVGLDISKYKDISPSNLSHGEKRRAAIAGILALNPECLILDEPTAGLDAAGIRLLEKVICEFTSAGKTAVTISHNIDFVISIAGRIIILHEGKIHFDGAKSSLVKNSQLITEIGFTLPRIIQLTKYLKQAGHLKNEEISYPEKIKERIVL